VRLGEPCGPRYAVGGQKWVEIEGSTANAARKCGLGLFSVTTACPCPVVWVSAKRAWMKVISPGCQAMWLDSSPLPTAVSVGGCLRIQASSDGTDCDFAVRSPSALKAGLLAMLPSNFASMASVSSASSSLAVRVSRSAGEVSLRSKPTRVSFQSKSPLAVSGSTRCGRLRLALIFGCAAPPRHR
jgi:hypothetical protein